MAEFTDPWPLRHLVLRTPRLELRPDDDEGLLELAAQAHEGIHPPEFMPFTEPWSDLPPDELVRSVMQFNWRQRAALEPGTWRLNFLVRKVGKDGSVIGTQGLSAKDFSVTRTVSTGSWIARAEQGNGVGTEMRAAVLLFAFDHLDANEAHSEAFADNPASLAVSRKLGYQRNGTTVLSRRNEPAEEVRLLVRPAEVKRPEWTLEVSGLDCCRPLLAP